MDSRGGGLRSMRVRRENKTDNSTDKDHTEDKNEIVYSPKLPTKMQKKCQIIIIQHCYTDYMSSYLFWARFKLTMKVQENFMKISVIHPQWWIWRIGKSPLHYMELNMHFQENIKIWNRTHNDLAMTFENQLFVELRV